MAKIKGTDKSETLNGTTSADTIEAKAGDDIINGLAGADTINGGDGKDTLNGGAGRDIMKGDAGSDTLIGGLDGDTMTGGAGADKFIINFGDSFSTSANKAAFDVITDFNKAQGDTISISNVGGAAAPIAASTNGFVNTANIGTISGFSIDNGGMLHLYSDKGTTHPEIKSVSQAQALDYAQKNAAALPHDAVIGIHTSGHTYLVDNQSVAGFTMVDLTGSGGNLSSLTGVIV